MPSCIHFSPFFPVHLKILSSNILKYVWAPRPLTINVWGVHVPHRPSYHQAQTQRPTHSQYQCLSCALLLCYSRRVNGTPDRMSTVLMKRLNCPMQRRRWEGSALNTLYCGSIGGFNLAKSLVFFLGMVFFFFNHTDVRDNNRRPVDKTCLCITCWYSF